MWKHHGFTVAPYDPDQPNDVYVMREGEVTRVWNGEGVRDAWYAAYRWIRIEIKKEQGYDAWIEGLLIASKHVRKNAQNPHPKSA